jgi:hypothetical protein
MVSDPVALIFDYLERQPITVRDNIYGIITYSFLGEEGMPGEEALPDGFVAAFKKAIESVFESTGPITRVRKIVMMMALIDYDMERRISKLEDAFEYLPSDTEIPPALQKLSLEAPLRRKHFQRAAAEWKKLRRSTLSFEALREFEATLWATSSRMSSA